MAQPFFPFLTLLLVIPVLGSIIVPLLGNNKRLIKITSIVLTLISLLITIYLWLNFDQNQTGFQFLEKYTWVKSLGVSYIVGIDGVSLPLLVLTSVLFFLTVVYSWNLETRIREFYSLMFVLQLGVTGVFITLDLLVFIVFWEIVLIPMYFIIGVWGGPRKDYAAIKFFIYTHVGSLIMLLGIIFLYFEAAPKLGAPSFSMIDIGRVSRDFSTFFQLLVFGLFLFAFGVKIPVVPVHTWLPDAHVEAPTEGSVILAGLLLKMGGYGLIRVAISLLPEGAVSYGTMMALIGIVSVIYGALISLSQKDLKKMIAYSSISHMGMVLLGLGAFNNLGFAGAVFQMFSHGLTSAALFMMSGSIQHSAHTRIIGSLGGIAAKMPKGAFMLTAAALGGAGLPGMSLFISEFSVLLGTFATFNLIVIIPAASIVITAAYFLWALQRALFGPYNERLGEIHDIRHYETLPLAILVLLLVIFGVFPWLLMNPIGTSTGQLVNFVIGR